MEFIEDLSEGVGEGCREFEVCLIGGNLSESQTVFINMTALGEVSSDDIVLRSGASAGDDIYVTGTLGDSALGLRALSGDCGIDGCEGAVSRHIEPTPRLQVGRMVAKRGIASSMIDVSDGLFCDLEKLTSEHGLGAEVNLGSLPLSPGFSFPLRQVLGGRLPPRSLRRGGLRASFHVFFAEPRLNRGGFAPLRDCHFEDRFCYRRGENKVFRRGGERRFFTIPLGLSTSADSSTGVKFFGAKISF